VKGIKQGKDEEIN